MPQCPKAVMAIRTIARLDNSGTEIRYSKVTSIQKDFEINGLSLKYVLEGEERYTLNDIPFRLRKGEYILVNRAVEASVHIESTDAVEGLCIDFGPDMLHGLSETLGIQDAHRLASRNDMLVHKRIGRCTDVAETLRRATLMVQHMDVGNPDEVRDVVFTLASSALAVQSESEDRLPTLNVSRIATSHHLMRQLLEARDYLSLTSMGAISVSDVASAVGMSDFHFIRLFGQTFGISPYKYGVKCRLQRAAQLLQGGMLASDVALDAGFQDLSSFSRAFVQHFGEPPSRYASAK